MKYKMLEREENGLCRVQALKDFGDVKKGDCWWLHRKRREPFARRRLLGIW